MSEIKTSENLKLLKIPKNASDRADYIQGIGKKELTIIGCTLLIALIMLIVAFVTDQNLMLWLFGAIMLVAIVVICVKRDSINESLVDKIMYIIKYQRSQKKYEFKQRDLLDIGE